MFKCSFKEKQNNNYDIFNILRAIAVLCVFGSHSCIVIREYHPGIQFPWFFSTPAWAAMWMFFIISGYLLGKGFYSGKYSIGFNGMCNFWINRLIRILPMYLFFIFLFFLFINPGWFIREGSNALIHMLTFTYNGRPGIDGTSATWFVSTIMQLYLLSPLFYRFVFSRIKKWHHIFMFILIISGLVFRVSTFYFKLYYYD